MSARRILLIACIMVWYCAAYGQGKDAIASELRTFFNYYITENAGPIKTFSKDTLNKYCCKAFLHKINTDKELDADPLLWVQDYDSGWVQTLKINRISAGAISKYRLCFFDNYEHKDICMMVYLRKEAGRWKICKTCSGGYCY